MRPNHAMPTKGRDIALRCPRPRPGGRNECASRSRCVIFVAPPDASLGGADGAARNPYPDWGQRQKCGLKWPPSDLGLLKFACGPYCTGVTVLEVIQRSAEFLSRKGVESPRLQVELLLANLLRLPRMGLYLNYDRVLTPKELADLRELVQRRGQREPLQQIVGSTSFCGLELSVNTKVLVPRPETELLAELGWQYLNAQRTARNGQGGDLTALDFGTGSGCLAIALAVKCPAVRVMAVDISAEALAVAQPNAARHQVESRIHFIAGDGLAALPAEARFDLIVANPPYIPSAEIATLDPEVRDHDPRLALDGGADGLDFYERLAREAGPRLKPGGRFMLEFGDGQECAVQKHFESQKWVVEAVKSDYSGKPRILIAHRAGQPEIG